MKKVLVSLLVLALAMSSVFAAVEFSGSATFGYQLNYDNDQFTAHIQGDDGDDTNTSSLKLNIADDEGLWSVYIEGNPSFDSSGAVAGDLTLDLMKLFGADSDFGLTLGFNANDRYTGDRVFANLSGDNYDRVRTNDGGYFTSLKVSYAGFSAAVAAAPKYQPAGPYFNGTAPEGDEGVGVEGKADLVATAKYSGNGIGASVNYAMVGDSAQGGEGIFGGAVDVNVGELANLGFDLGVSASDRYGFGNKTNDLAVAVYGGTDAFDLGVEYALTSTEGANTSALYIGANLNVVENLGLKIYTGTYDVVNWGEQLYVGASASYSISTVTVGLGIEYAAGKSNAYDNSGLNIVPTVKVSF